ncbi:hypothetical protein C8R43DRAFT_976987 [Mycena crocata]|nr:hypothetical protein C8R43DRAFT_976987 [Mycena crocata]
MSGAVLGDVLKGSFSRRRETYPFAQVIVLSVVSFCWLDFKTTGRRFTFKGTIHFAVSCREHCRQLLEFTFWNLTLQRSPNFLLFLAEEVSWIDRQETHSQMTCKASRTRPVYYAWLAAGLRVMALVSGRQLLQD